MAKIQKSERAGPKNEKVVKKVKNEKIKPTTKVNLQSKSIKKKSVGIVVKQKQK